MDKKGDHYCAKVVAESGDRLIVEVPGPFPEGHRIVTAMVNRDSGKVYSIGLTVERDYLAAFLDYQVRFGMLDRHPTDEEMDNLMRSLSTAMNECVTSVMAAFARMAVASLGSDANSIHQARIDSATASLLKMYKNITGNSADKETMEAIRRDVQEYIENIDELPEDMPLMDIARLHEDRLQEILDRYAPTSEIDKIKADLAAAFTGNGDLSDCVRDYVEHYAGSYNAPKIVEECVKKIFSERTASLQEMLDGLKSVLESHDIPFDPQYYKDNV